MQWTKKCFEKSKTKTHLSKRTTVFISAFSSLFITWTVSVTDSDLNIRMISVIIHLLYQTYTNYFQKSHRIYWSQGVTFTFATSFWALVICMVKMIAKFCIKLKDVSYSSPKTREILPWRTHCREGYPCKPNFSHLEPLSSPIRGLIPNKGLIIDPSCENFFRFFWRALEEFYWRITEVFFFSVTLSSDFCSDLKFSEVKSLQIDNYRTFIGQFGAIMR